MKYLLTEEQADKIVEMIRNESVVENTKLKNLLKKSLENREFEFSFVDTSWDDNRVTEEYTIEYHIEVKEVLGDSSDAEGSVDVIIDNILLNGEDFYYDFVNGGYSESWYIDYLYHHLINEVFDLFPFRVHITIYGHDEERKS